MFLKEIILRNFKNFQEQRFEFSPKINAFVGANGIGKTNALDAIHYLSLTKSYLNYSDTQNIRFDEDFFSIEGIFEKNTISEVVFCGVQREKPKIFKKNSKIYERISDHIGQFPVVMISPYDLDLIKEGSEIRRKFIDAIISQSNKEYLQKLMRYNRILVQRNSLLKYFFQNNTFDKTSLSIYDEELCILGEFIHRERKKFIDDFLPVFQHYYKILSKGNETVKIEYKSQLNGASFADLLQENLAKDRAAQYSTQGIHKDDLDLTIISYPIKKFGSQGQQKSYLIALKLAQLELMKTYLQITPLLLLDDIFDKLDESRVEQLIYLVNDSRFGQIFISDTHPERTESIIQRINSDSKIIRL
ncbi:MAG: DNA replication/repair protein RecF [Weeksellaceae bacterium]|jgi:DNA replication and repair protein RecF|nr:DNA replication/repair protein RecF [Weeksellaceae bacterium]MDX9704118.1 DNA replication/repair protein RecF [Weeksellaceae bacterium]